jgi:beta-glucosidase
MELTDRDAANPKLLAPEKNAGGIERAVEAAQKSDLAILFLGDDEFTAKEAYFRDGVKGDRATLELVGQQEELFRAVKATGRPVIVVVKARRSLSIPTIAKDADAILYMWETGEQGDRAIAMLLSGQANPSGRLPVSLPRHVGQLPVHYSQKRINFKKGYLFEEDGPLYPFGYGLSYTSFAYGPLTLSSPNMREGAPITASINIRNSGTRAGQEVVQLYISDPVATVTRPIKELKAFQKIMLQPGETREVRFAITPDMLRHTGADMEPDPGYGAFGIEVAPSSAGGGAVAQAEFQKP